LIPLSIYQAAKRAQGLRRERKRTQWALTREEMKNCIWVKAELVVQIEFGEWTPDGHLRHSRFVALRDDKNPHEVGREAEH
jgi:ATP-dependent DNA ligase